MRFRCVAVTAAIALAVAAPLKAQVLSPVPFYRPGLMFDAHLIGGALSFQSISKWKAGPGGGVTIGYGATPTSTGFIGVDRSSVRINARNFEGQYHLTQYDLGVRYQDGFPHKKWNGYASVALSLMYATAGKEDIDSHTTSVKLSGTGAAIGGGVQRFFKRTVAFDAGLKLTTGRFSNLETNGFSGLSLSSHGSYALRLTTGLVWYPQLPKPHR